MECKCGWEMWQLVGGKYWTYYCPGCGRLYKKENQLVEVRMSWVEPDYLKASLELTKKEEKPT